jgi:hypothetical protein
MSMQATILLMSLATLACAAAIGVTLGVTTMRRALGRHALADGRLADLDQTDQGYLLASALASVAAFAAFRVDYSVFLLLVSCSAIFLMAEHVILPRLKRDAEAGLPPARDFRTTFEMAQALLLLLAFFMLTLPPLSTLARVWGV